MPNLSQVKNILIENLNDVLSGWGGVIIKDKTNNPKPDGLFIRVSVLNIADICKSKEFNKTTGINTLNFLNEIIFDITCFGENALNYLYELNKKLNKAAVNETFNNNKISIIDIGKIKELPIVEGEQIKQKSNLELKLYFVDTLNDDIGYFDKVELKADFIVINKTFLIEA